MLVELAAAGTDLKVEALRSPALVPEAAAAEAAAQALRGRYCDAGARYAEAGAVGINAGWRSQRLLAGRDHTNRLDTEAA